MLDIGAGTRTDTGDFSQRYISSPTNVSVGKLGSMVFTGGSMQTVGDTMTISRAQGRSVDFFFENMDAVVNRSTGQVSKFDSAIRLDPRALSGLSKAEKITKAREAFAGLMNKLGASYDPNTAGMQQVYERLAQGKALSVDYDNGLLQVKDGSRVIAGNQAQRLNEDIVKGAHGMVDPDSVRTYVTNDTNSAYVRAITDRMLNDESFRDSTFTTAAKMLNQYKIWQGQDKTQEIGQLSSKLGIDLFKGRLASESTEMTSTDLNYAIVKRVWNDAEKKAKMATIDGSINEEVFREEFHKNFQKVFKTYETWASTRNEGQYGADRTYNKIDNLSKHVAQKIAPYTKDEYVEKIPIQDRH